MLRKRSCKTYVCFKILDASVASKSCVTASWLEEANAAMHNAQGGQFLCTFQSQISQCLQFLQSLWNAAQIRHGVSCLILRQRPCRLYRWKESLVWLLRGQGWALWSTLIRPVGCSTISLHYVRSCKPQLKAHLRLHVQMQEMCTLTHTQIPPRKPPLPMLVVPSRSHLVRQIDSNQWKEIYLSNVHTSICTNHILHRHQLISRKEASKIHIHARNVTSPHLIWLLYSLH